MHQIRFRLRLRPKPPLGSLQRSPKPLAGFKGPLLREGRGGRTEEKGKGEGKRRRRYGKEKEKVREGRGGERNERVREGKERRGRKLPSVPPVPNLPLHHCWGTVVTAAQVPPPTLKKLQIRLRLLTYLLICLSWHVLSR